MNTIKAQYCSNMKSKIFSAIIILFTAIVTAEATDDNKIIAKDTAEKTIKIGPKTIPVLIFSGEKDESITLKLPAIPANCLGIRIEAVVTQLDDNSDDKLEDAYQAQACQITPEKKGNKQNNLSRRMDSAFKKGI